MKLPSELLYAIVDLCLEQDLRQCQRLPSSSFRPTSSQLVLLNRVAYNFIVQNSSYHRLRLWKHLCQIPRQVEPIQLAVGELDHFTILKVEVQCERIDNRNYEHFLVLEERMKRNCEPSKWKNHTLYLEHQQKHNTIPYFHLQGFFKDLKMIANENTMSIWLWKRRSHSLFTLARTKGLFRPILDTEQKLLMAWDRPSLFNQEGLTETFLLFNTELFGKLL